MALTVKAPAKINLGLDVLHQRDDGFHEVKMVMASVDLADDLDIQEISSGIGVTTSSGELPKDERNLAYQAAQLIKEEFNIRTGVKIFIDKKIPISAGLAGGSSDAAAILRGLNILWRLGCSRAQLAELGSRIGSDIPFCIYGGTALATGRGEVITPLSPLLSCWVVLAKPEASLSTKEMYHALQLGKLDHPSIDEMVQNVQAGDYYGVCRLMGNVFEPYAIRKLPEVQELKQKMIQLGADGARVSGSGPTVFGLSNTALQAEAISNGLRGICSDVFKVRMLGENKIDTYVTKKVAPSNGWNDGEIRK